MAFEEGDLLILDPFCTHSASEFRQAATPRSRGLRPWILVQGSRLVGLLWCFPVREGPPTPRAQGSGCRAQAVAEATGIPGRHVLFSLVATRASIGTTSPG